MRVRAEVRGRLFPNNPQSCSITLYLTALRQGLSLKLQIGWWSVSPKDPPVSEPYPKFWGYRLSHSQLFM